MEVVVAAATGIILRRAVTSIAAAVASVIRLAVAAAFASVARPGIAAAVAAPVRPCGEGHPAPYQGAEQQN